MFYSELFWPRLLWSSDKAAGALRPIVGRMINMRLDWNRAKNAIDIVEAKYSSLVLPISDGHANDSHEFPKSKHLDKKLSLHYKPLQHYKRLEGNLFRR